MTVASTVVLLFAIAMGVAMVTRRLPIPYTVALVIVGLMLGATRIVPAPHLTKELLYVALLPGLLFEAAFHLDARDFWRDKVTIVGLAVPGVLVSIALTTALLSVAAGAVGLPTSFSWRGALVFSALIAATDPIAVVALFRTLGAPKRLVVVVEAESLLNDGTAVVFYAMALGLATGSGVSAWGATAEFARVVGLGLLVGAALGFGISELIARIDDPLVEITLTTIAAYGSFVLAEQLRASGVLATVTAGVLCGSYGAPRGMSASTRIAVQSFWSYVAFALNSFVFLLIGFQVEIKRLLYAWGAILFAYAAVMATRAAIVFLMASATRRTREAAPWSYSVIVAWGGLRGALSMVLALSLAEGFPGRELVEELTFGVVLLSILVNGVTVGPLLRRLGLVEAASARRP